MAIKVTKGQIYNGTMCISKNDCTIDHFTMYHFDTSDQRKKPVYIPHIALALKC